APRVQCSFPSRHSSDLVGAGAGAVAGGLAGGVGNASAVLPGGGTVASLVVVNAAGSVLDPGSGRLAGARYGLPGEFDRLREPREDRKSTRLNSSHLKIS